MYLGGGVAVGVFLCCYLGVGCWFVWFFFFNNKLKDFHTNFIVWAMKKKITRFNKEKEKFKMSLQLQRSENMLFQEIHIGVNRLLNQYSHLPYITVLSSKHLPFSCQSTTGLNVPRVILYGAKGEVCRYLSSCHATFHVLLVCKDENCSLP